MHRWLRRFGLWGSFAGYFLHPRKGARRRARVLGFADRLARRAGVRIPHATTR